MSIHTQVQPTQCLTKLLNILIRVGVGVSRKYRWSYVFHVASIHTASALMGGINAVQAPLFVAQRAKRRKVTVCYGAWYLCFFPRGRLYWCPET